MRQSRLSSGVRELLFSCILALVLPAPLARAGTWRFYPTDDATPGRGGAYSLLTVGRGELAYLRFDLSGMCPCPEVTRATLWLSRYETDPTWIAVHGVDDDTWTEEGITPANAPAYGPLVDKQWVPSTLGWSTWDVTPLVQPLVRSASVVVDHILSVVVKAYDPTSNIPTAFLSKEAGVGYRPYLEVEGCGKDLGDARDPPYPTLLAHNGAWHLIWPGLCLGSIVDAEADGQPDADALGDDSAGSDDEDGVVFMSDLVPGSTADVDVLVSSASGQAYLTAWVDFNGDGDWSDAGERIISRSFATGWGWTHLAFDVPADAVPGETYARFRVTPNWEIEPSGPGPFSGENFGEVEDYKVTIMPPPGMEDFGDAPSPYPTLRADNGARHQIVPGVFLGHRVDGEPDGQPDSSALGDDQTGLHDDEDGVVFASLLVRGTNACVDVGASCKGYLSAWLDFNGDGDWADAGETILLSRPLASGPNRLSFAVPADASLGRTYARFRFSTAPIPDFAGPCDDGEVEDYEVRILDHEGPKAFVDRLKWSQPPLERDPIDAPGQYCGGSDQPSYYPDTSHGWQIAADDFMCLGAMPVTSVHWWGSYPGWRESNPPAVGLYFFRIGFWSNVPAGTWHSRCPGTLLSQVDIPIRRVAREWVGWSENDAPQTPDSCFQYSVELEPGEYFWQDAFRAGTADDTFWISIVAIYDPMPRLGSAWEWKTRPSAPGDAGVKFRAPIVAPGFVLDPRDPSLSLIQQVHPLGDWIKSFDLAFELDTDARCVKWAQPFTHLRDWPHYEDRTSMATWEFGGCSQEPDLTNTGVDVAATCLFPPLEEYNDVIVADDFSVTWTGAVTSITLWGSWKGDLLPKDHPANMAFNVSIREDNAGAPGNALWKRQFNKSAFTVEASDSVPESFYDPDQNVYSRSDHTKVYKYSLHVDPNVAFVPAGTPESPKVYWLSVQAQVALAPGSMGTARFGWKTSARHAGSPARWVVALEPYAGPWTNELDYPPGHPSSSQPMDMAFSLAVESGLAGGSIVVQELVADDWECQSPGPVTAAVWWGSYQGYGCENCTVPSSRLEPPPRPDYFQLSIWSDVPNPDPRDPSQFSHPGKKLWDYKVTDYEESLVGLDKHPYGEPNEAVFRYSVRLPKESWFYQPTSRGIYWFSVAAVYGGEARATYPWGWTNHAHVFHDNAVTGSSVGGSSGVWTWRPLTDQTGGGEDMSFLLFTEPQ